MIEPPDEAGERHETQGKSLVCTLFGTHLIEHQAHHSRLFPDGLELFLNREGRRGGRDLFLILRRRSSNQQAGENTGRGAEDADMCTSAAARRHCGDGRLRRRVPGDSVHDLHHRLGRADSARGLHHRLGRADSVHGLHRQPAPEGCRRQRRRQVLADSVHGLHRQPAPEGCRRQRHLLVRVDSVLFYLA